jgi:hypothetical protein
LSGSGKLIFILINLPEPLFCLVAKSMAISEQTKGAFYDHLRQVEGLAITRSQSDSLLTDLVKVFRLVNRIEIER